MSVFSEFWPMAKIILFMWMMLGGSYYLVRIPPSERRTAKDFQDQTKIFLIFLALAVGFAVAVVCIYIFHSL